MTKKQERLVFFHRAMDNYGISIEDREALRRIEKALHRWAELECGNSNGYASWDIERDEQTGKPYLVTYHHLHQGSTHRSRTPVVDREKRALKRLDEIMKRYPQLVAYPQGDPRGCALYLVRVTDIPKDVDLDSCYTRGIAVCI